MSFRTFAVGILALVAGTAAAVAANRIIQSRPPIQLQPAESVEIVVAKHLVHRGRSVESEDLAVHKWPADSVPSGAIREVSEAEGRVAYTTHFPSQPILQSSLAPRDAHSGLATIVPSGMRAFTIHIPTVATGVAGFVLPGNYVDILLTLRQGSGMESMTVTLLQRVEILAVDQELDTPADNKVDAKQLSSVTLLVTPEQAAKLSLAESRGILQLTLRNPDDETPASIEPISLADLQLLAEEPLPTVAETGDAEPEQPQPKSKLLQIRTLRGTSSGVVMVKVPIDSAQGEEK